MPRSVDIVLSVIRHLSTSLVSSSKLPWFVSYQSIDSSSRRHRRLSVATLLGHSGRYFSIQTDSGCISVLLLLTETVLSSLSYLSPRLTYYCVFLFLLVYYCRLHYFVVKKIVYKNLFRSSSSVHAKRIEHLDDGSEYNSKHTNHPITALLAVYKWYFNRF